MESTTESSHTEKCPVCNNSGYYPIINVRGRHLYDIRCPECLGEPEAYFAAEAAAQAC